MDKSIPTNHSQMNKFKRYIIWNAEYWKRVMVIILHLIKTWKGELRNRNHHIMQRTMGYIIEVYMKYIHCLIMNAQSLDFCRLCISYIIAQQVNSSLELAIPVYMKESEWYTDKLQVKHIVRWFLIISTLTLSLESCIVALWREFQMTFITSFHKSFYV